MEESPNVTRITMRPLWDSHSALGTPNEINVYTILQLAKNPLADTDEIWDHWIRRRYKLEKQEDIDKMAALLRNTYPAAKKILYTFGVRMADHSHMARFDIFQSRLYNYAKALHCWDPSPENRQILYDLTVNPGKKILRITKEEHDEALRLTRQSLAMLDELADSLSGEDYADVRKRLLNTEIMANLHFYQMDAYLRLRAWQLKDDKSVLPELENKLNKLEALICELKKDPEPVCYLFSPNNVADFITRCRQELS